ncbi:MAG: arginine deiminase-related protein [Bacteroidota bacterium]
MQNIPIATTLPTNRQQITDTLLMIRPSNFGFNFDTAPNNAFQENDPSLSREAIKAAAVEEFDAFVEKLRAVGINVVVYQERPGAISTDSVFPNNWFSCHSEGLLVTYPMFSPIRRAERQEEVIELMQDQFNIKTHIRLEKWEKSDQYLEGTGSMILDRQHQLAYACRSVRTNEELMDQFCYFMCYEKVLFDATDANGLPIYHTNVMMALGTDFVVICLATINDAEQKALLLAHFERTRKTVIDITLSQMASFAGNMLQVKNKQGESYLIMSEQAYQSLTAEQVATIKSHSNILYSDLKVIETYGGGSARCMMAEVFFSSPSQNSI